jgi:cysteine desulfurase/selenocysteine lyase
MAGMTSTAVSVLDAHRLRRDFAVFDELVDGKPVAFLDSAASTQKPRQVLDRMRRFYEHEYANVHRGVYRLAERATEGFEGARRTVAGFLNAPSEREIVFTRSATEALDLVAYA